MLHKKYLLEFKSAAVRQLESGKDINELAHTLGVNPNTLRAWYHKSKKNSWPGGVNNTVIVQKISADGQLTRLRAPNPSSKTTIH